jgi:hypothetical protein
MAKRNPVSLDLLGPVPVLGEAHLVCGLLSSSSHLAGDIQVEGWTSNSCRGQVQPYPGLTSQKQPDRVHRLGTERNPCHHEMAYYLRVPSGEGYVGVCD